MFDRFELCVLDVYVILGLVGLLGFLTIAGWHYLAKARKDIEELKEKQESAISPVEPNKGAKK